MINHIEPALIARDPLQYFEQHETTQVCPDALTIYQQNRVGVRIQAIVKTYPCANFLLPKDLVAAIANQFINSKPAGTPLEQLGHGFCRWLCLQPQAIGLLKDFPFLPALLNWEWGWHNAYFAPRWRPLQPEQVLEKLQRDEDSAMPQWLLNQGLSIIRTHYPIEQIWRTIKQMMLNEEVELEITTEPAQLWLLVPTATDVTITPFSHNQLVQLQLLRKPWLQRATSLQPEFVATAIQHHWLVMDYL